MSNKPNVIIIMTDQQQAKLRKREGCLSDTMPFLDQLAKEGVDFKRAYTSMPVCAPARVSLFTGRFPSATAVKTNHNLKDAYFEKDLIKLLKENRYKTALCGKNHSHLSENDFDFCSIFSHGGGQGLNRTKEQKQFDKYMSDLKHMTAHEPTPYPLECQSSYRIVDKAKECIDSFRENPFFLWLSFPEPHNPYQVPEPYFNMFPPEELPPLQATKNDLDKKGFKYSWLRSMWEKVTPELDKTIERTRSNYFGMLRLIDDQIKRFVNYLEEKNLQEDTIIIFLSDHGDFAGEYGLIRKGPELPEVLSRIPMVITGPGIISCEKQHEAHVSIIDILPTLCEAIDIDIPAGVQGRSLWSILSGQDYPDEEFSSIYCEHGFGGQYYTKSDKLNPVDEGAINDGCTFDELNSWTQAGTMRMVRKGDWKLTYDMEGNGQLYNLVEDPAELDNLFGQDKVKNRKEELMEELLQWTLWSQDTLPYPERRYQVKTNPANYRKNYF